ncbi:hypothetical protein Sjap_015180 [Stephania japonica]|uniref:Uncharacterized protein n=1 Tax=Stephania japonica TaxID=461633 RepID=A0AAP0IIR7_9MAGN
MRDVLAVVVVVIDDLTPTKPFIVLRFQEILDIPRIEVLQREIKRRGNYRIGII